MPVAMRAVRRRDILDISPVLQDVAAAVVDDSFLRCFQSRPPEPWDWNVFMLPTHYVGMAFRWLILFPLRLIAAVLGWLLFLALFFSIPYALKVRHHAISLRCVAGQPCIAVLMASWAANLDWLVERAHSVDVSECVGGPAEDGAAAAAAADADADPAGDVVRPHKVPWTAARASAQQGDSPGPFCAPCCSVSRTGCRGVGIACMISILLLLRCCLNTPQALVRWSPQHEWPLLRKGSRACTCERWLHQACAGAFSQLGRWHAQVWVANHSSIIDYAVLSAATPFACIMQLQPGFLGFLQTRVLPCVGGLFFNRTEARMLVFEGCARF